MLVAVNPLPVIVNVELSIPDNFDKDSWAKASAAVPEGLTLISSLCKEVIWLASVTLTVMWYIPGTVVDAVSNAMFVLFRFPRAGLNDFPRAVPPSADTVSDPVSAVPSNIGVNPAGRPINDTSTSSESNPARDEIVKVEFAVSLPRETGAREFSEILFENFIPVPLAITSKSPVTVLCELSLIVIGNTPSEVTFLTEIVCE